MTEQLRKKVILDVDTGSDDAIAIMLAALSPELDILGITVTWGNRPVENCVENTLRVLELLGKEKDIPVFKGCPQPMVRNLTKQRNAALDMDGISVQKDGKEYSVHPPFLNLPPAAAKAQPLHACSYLVETLMQTEEKITLIPVGPPTNLGMALRMEPSIADRVEEVVFMGGAVGMGNITPCAEANFYHDPEAAKIILDSGVSCRIIGLNATHSAELDLEDASRLKALGTPASRLAAELLETRIEALGIMGDGNGCSDAVHDALAVAGVIMPEVITDARQCRCDIDINGGAADGQLIVDNRIRHQKDGGGKTQVAYRADKEMFFSLLCDRLGQDAFPCSPSSNPLEPHQRLGAEGGDEEGPEHD